MRLPTESAVSRADARRAGARRPFGVTVRSDARRAFASAVAGRCQDPARVRTISIRRFSAASGFFASRNSVAPSPTAVSIAGSAPCSTR